MTSSCADAPENCRPMSQDERKIVFVSTLGSVFEFYDFFLSATLASVIGSNFFGMFAPPARDFLALLAFGAGCFARPFGAMFFGRVGDVLGRKYTFLITAMIMGAATFAIGLSPGSQTIGAFAPFLLIALRILQGLALGGEYGGAAVYVAEHAPQGRRGFYTAWIQTAATGGLLLSLLVVLCARSALGEERFLTWGWRLPFLLSAVFLGLSLWVRFKLNESPAFRRMKQAGASSRGPITESFGRWRNLRSVLIALFGLVAGQGVVWYASQFYSMFFLQDILMTDAASANLLLVWPLFLSLGFFVFFGWLSDKIGRKPIILGGCLIAAATYFPIFEEISSLANPALAKAAAAVKIVVVANPSDCSTFPNPFATQPPKACDQIRQVLSEAKIPYKTLLEAQAQSVAVRIGAHEVAFEAANAEQSAQNLLAEARIAGYPGKGDPSIVKMRHIFDVFNPQTGKIIFWLFVLVLYATMVYGPLAAALTELFPTRIRYTAASLPYHIGNGWFGGLSPALALAMTAWSGNIYFGLWFPVTVALTTFVFGLIFAPETKNRDIFLEDVSR